MKAVTTFNLSLHSCIWWRNTWYCCKDDASVVSAGGDAFVFGGLFTTVLGILFGVRCSSLSVSESSVSESSVNLSPSSPIRRKWTAQFGLATTAARLRVNVQIWSMRCVFSSSEMEGTSMAFLVAWMLLSMLRSCGAGQKYEVKINDGCDESWICQKYARWHLAIGPPVNIVLAANFFHQGCAYSHALSDLGNRQVVVRPQDVYRNFFGHSNHCNSFLVDEFLLGRFAIFFDSPTRRSLIRRLGWDFDLNEMQTRSQVRVKISEAGQSVLEISFRSWVQVEGEGGFGLTYLVPFSEGAFSMRREELAACMLSSFKECALRAIVRCLRAGYKCILRTARETCVWYILW